MPTNVKYKIGKLSPAQRKKVEARATELIAEEMTLRELRRARKLTQVRIAKALGITQDGVSRLEKRSDLLLSTLRKTVEAMGGNLSLAAEFPDRARSFCPALRETMQGLNWQGEKKRTRSWAPGRDGSTMRIRNAASSRLSAGRPIKLWLSSR